MLATLFSGMPSPNRTPFSMSQSSIFCFLKQQVQTAPELNVSTRVLLSPLMPAGNFLSLRRVTSQMKIVESSLSDLSPVPYATARNLPSGLNFADIILAPRCGVNGSTTGRRSYHVHDHDIRSADEYSKCTVRANRRKPSIFERMSSDLIETWLHCECLL